MGDMKYEFKIGDKLWEKHNHRVVTLKENHRTDSVTKWWHIEEDSMEYREDSLTNIPPYVYLLLKKQQKVEELLELYQYLNENTNDYDLNPDEVDEIHNKIYELEEVTK